jgi:hypothetical protein
VYLYLFISHATTLLLLLLLQLFFWFRSKVRSRAMLQLTHLMPAGSTNDHCVTCSTQQLHNDAAAAAVGFCEAWLLSCAVRRYCIMH